MENNNRLTKIRKFKIITHVYIFWRQINSKLSTEIVQWIHVYFYTKPLRFFVTHVIEQLQNEELKEQKSKIQFNFAKNMCPSLKNKIYLQKYLN